MQWMLIPWLRCSLLALNMAAIRFITGVSLPDRWHAQPASQLPIFCEETYGSEDSFCIWCSYLCLRRQEATAHTIDTLMSSRENGVAAARTRFLPQLGPPYIHPDFMRLENGVQSVTRPLHTICGSLLPSASYAAVPLPWTHLTSHELSQKPCPHSRAAPSRLCLGKQLRASKFRLQAKRILRHRKLKRRTLTRPQQVAARLFTTVDGWSTRLDLCAHHLQGSCRVLLLQVVVPLMQYAATRCAFIQALRSSSTRILPASLHGIRWASPGPHVTGPDQTHTPPALPNGPLRFRPLRVDCTSCLHLP